MAPDWLDPLLTGLAQRRTGWLSRALADVPEGVRRAAVLVLFGEGPSGPDVLLIEKSPHLRTHAGQPAFPGGGIEPGDATPADAALREAHEETGLDPSGVDVLRTLPELWVPPSGNAVTPVVAWWREPSEVSAFDPVEVASVARVPIADLVDPANRLQVVAPRGYVSPAFTVAGMLVWGFTAGVLDELMSVAGWSVPWDKTRVEPLPGDLPAVAADDVIEPFAEGA